MSIKQFLKPDWRRIVIFLFFFFILGFVLISIGMRFFTAPNSDCLGCQSPEYFNILIGIFYPFGLGLFNYLANVEKITFTDFYSRIAMFSLLFIINSFSWYLLSCIMVWIYDKFKKVKSKK